ncbi:MAG: 5-(carboxyamino)imidazole ribonucleotide synthase, partial [Pirellulales bacterium]|nr:5-(carboxyamino)imidazole ribonucleotide synthase [Pirellulales bacterium]
MDVQTSPSADSSVSTLLPGATIGMVGGGQLGRMFAIAAASMGYRV